MRTTLLTAISILALSTTPALADNSTSTITQRDLGNRAAANQVGGKLGGKSYIEQTGSGQRAVLTQADDGTSNSSATLANDSEIVQRGRSNQAEVNQVGETIYRVNSSKIVQYDAYNKATVIQHDDGQRSTVEQRGDRQTAIVRQGRINSGDLTYNNSSQVRQAGTLNNATVDQTGRIGTSVVGQVGLQNIAEIEQGGVANGSIVDQHDQGNLAAVDQVGIDAASQVRQTGRGEQARVAQSGALNRSDILQTGRNQLAVVTQSGRNDTSTIGQQGAFQQASVIQSGDNNHSMISQNGPTANHALVFQLTNSNSSTITQAGRGLTATVRQ